MNAASVRDLIRNTSSRTTRNQGWAWLQRYAADHATPPFPDDYGRHVHGGWTPTCLGYERCAGCNLERVAVP